MANPSKRTKHPLDNEADAQAAIAAGWILDTDLWWHREARPTDKPIPPNNDHFGFDMIGEPWDPKDGPPHVFVRAAAFALSYDKGVIVPYAANDQAAG